MSLAASASERAMWLARLISWLRKADCIRICEITFEFVCKERESLVSSSERTNMSNSES